jgi:uncharacterized membrane protein YhaH (DUF805 family)
MSTTRPLSTKILQGYEALVLAFLRSVWSAFRNFADYEGRASRSEFWNWMLFLLLAQFSIAGYPGYVRVVFLLFLTPPDLALQVRRLHDIGRTGFWVIAYYFALVLFVAFLNESSDAQWLALPFGLCLAIFFYWLITKGTPGPNRYGPDRLVRRQNAEPVFSQHVTP